MIRACDGCGRPGVLKTLWLAAPLGDCVVRVHRHRPCAEAAREKRGGGRFHPRFLTKEEKAQGRRLWDDEGERIEPEAVEAVEGAEDEADA